MRALADRLRRTAAAAVVAWDRLAPRERALASAGAVLVLLAVVVRVGLAAHDDFAALERRVATAERELRDVRRLAARLGPSTAGAPGDAPLVSRLEKVAESVVGRERIAAIAPADERRPESGLALRVSDASLAETVRLLHALESGSPPLGVTGLELARHADDPGRFGLRVEVASGGATP